MFTPLSLNDFEKRTNIKLFDFTQGWEKANKIVSLREVDQVLGVQPMQVGYLHQLLSNVPLRGNALKKPYENCQINPVRIDPSSVVIGQTFIQRNKYQSFIEDFPAIFGDFCVTPGVSNYNASIVIGQKDGDIVLSHYLPPIIEQHNNQHCLLDGVHRAFLAKKVGMTIEAIVITGVETPFPCDLNHWDSVDVVREKPPKPERFFNLSSDLFRDIKAVGIDG